MRIAFATRIDYSDKTLDYTDWQQGGQEAAHQKIRVSGYEKTHSCLVFWSSDFLPPGPLIIWYPPNGAGRLRQLPGNLINQETTEVDLIFLPL
jgi:hypothetical protein